jgi:hypothetical protein
MLRIPRFNVETIDSGLGRGVHPAFVVDGKEVSEIFVGKKNARIIDGRAYSIPGEYPDSRINFDEARDACTKKGRGWHLLSSWEYAALVMYVVKTKSTYFDKDWWDWLDGLKIVNGEIFAPQDNAFEMAETDWPSMVAFFDDIKGRPVLGKEVTHYTESDPKGAEDDRDGDYTNLDRISALEYLHDFNQVQIEKLAQLLIIPSATSVLSETDESIYVRNYGERLPIRGGHWSGGAGAGLAALNLVSRRSSSGNGIGFRPAFIGI